jgi:hypothetical protein
MPATTFVSSADPEIHAQLAACFVAGIMVTLPAVDGRMTLEQLSEAAAGLIAMLAGVLGCMPASDSSVGRQRLADGIAVELMMEMDRLRSLVPHLAHGVQ